MNIFGVDLAKAVIIDNCSHKFRLQKNNVIPITSWSADSQEAELLSLLPFLEKLVEVDDLRPIIAMDMAITRRKWRTRKRVILQKFCL